MSKCDFDSRIKGSIHGFTSNVSNYTAISLRISHNCIVAGILFPEFVTTLT